MWKKLCEEIFLSYIFIDMPAVSMVCDSSIVSAAIRDSLAPSVSSTTSDAFSNTDSRIDANVRSASLRKIEYQEVGSYSSVLQELKQKYPVLKPNNSNSNGFVKTPTNGLTNQHQTLQDSGNTKSKYFFHICFVYLSFHGVGKFYIKKRKFLLNNFTFSTKYIN